MDEIVSQTRSIEVPRTFELSYVELTMIQNKYTNRLFVGC